MPTLKLPAKLEPLLYPKRTKVAYGGRGSGKSWTFARVLLQQGTIRPIRVLCAREVQKSIKQSVHTLLEDQIQILGLGSLYTVTEAEIRGTNGTTFSFSGLATHTVESIKSFEGVDIVWVEEAQTVSKRSWDILTPTIRKEGSEIWVSFNPDLDTDETYKRFVLNPPPDSVVVCINYSDNPWFPKVLEKERIHCRETSPTDYENIWEGKCKAAVEGAIYANEIREAQEKGRVLDLPYDPMLKVHAVFDLGWNDATAIALVQRQLSSIRILEYIEDDHKTLDYYSSILKDKRYNWGTIWLPHDGRSKDITSGVSSEEILLRLGWNVSIVPEIGIEQGIKVARMAFGKVYFDRRTEKLVNCLKRYRRSINQMTNEPGAPLHDEYSHGADCFRYMCVVADKMGNESRFDEKIHYPKLGLV